MEDAPTEPRRSDPGPRSSDSDPAGPPYGRAGVVVDLVMLGLLAVNLSWLLFEATLGGSAVFRTFLAERLPRAFAAYDTWVHQNFVLVDMVFVTLFVAELLSRWAFAVKRRTYHRWFFYPLIHWYDVLGCMPFASMRFLRVLRLVALVYRLDRQGYIDVRRFYLYRVFEKYRDILTEEISDRVVVRILEGVQAEMTHGTPVVERIWKEVVQPQREEITARVTHRTESVLRDTLAREGPALHAYVDEVLRDALGRSQHAFHALDRIPLAGDLVIKEIEEAIHIIVQNVVTKLVRDAHELELAPITAEVERAVGEVFAARDLQADHLVREVMHQSIDVVKEQVRVQRWKMREAEQEEPAEPPQDRPPRGPGILRPASGNVSS